MDKVIIKDLTARGIIGVNDWERKKPQEILINIELYCDLSRPGNTDDIEDSINYRTVAKDAQRLAETCERLTVEALAADISEVCLKNPRVQRAKIRVEKPGAVRFAHSAGVEIDRSH